MRAILAPLLLVAPLVAGAPDAAEEPWCVLHRLNIRTSKGDPVQFETKEDGSIEATLCEDMPNFFVTAEPVEPTFSSGKKCALKGVPGNPVEVERGQEKKVEIFTYETDPKKPSEETPLTVKRLDIGVDQWACTVTRTRSAAEDCGYAPFLEDARQKAASMPDSGIPMPEAPVNTVTEAGAAALAQTKGIFRSDGHIHPNVQDSRNKPPGQNVLRRIRKLQKQAQSPLKKKARSAKWQHLKRRPGMSGVDGC